MHLIPSSIEIVKPHSQINNVRPRSARPELSARLVSGLAVLAVFCALPAPAAPLYYDRAANPGWFSGTGWSTSDSGPFDQPWSDGNEAVIVGGTGTANVSLDGNTATVTGLARSDGAITNFTDGTMNFDNASITGTSLLRFSLAVTGNFTLSGTNLLDFVSTTAGLYSNIGTVTLDSGEFRIGWVSNQEIQVTVSGLTGSGGSITTRAHAGNDANPTQTLTINQNATTTFSGVIEGTGTAGGSNNFLKLNKSGAGSLTLAGTINNLQRTTDVNGGALLINSSSTSFGDGVGNTAIAIHNGGALGGTGTISTLAGDSVVVAEGGSLIAGLAGSAGQTTYALGAGASLDISAAAGNGGGWLNFALGSDTTAGTSYDHILLSSGSLAIGSGDLRFSDFDFDPLAGFGVGTYTLFATPDLNGSLAAPEFLSGMINGFDSTLSIMGNDLVLSVIPEPSTALLFFAAGVVFFALRRHTPIKRSR